MFEFLLSNWVIFLIVFVLLLLILIGYLIDHDNVKKSKHKDNNITMQKDNNITKQKENNIKAGSYEKENRNSSKIQNPVSLTDEYIDQNQDKFNCFYDDLFENENNELDTEFNKIVSKQNIFDDSFKKGIENIKIDSITSSEKYQYVTSDIILPDIRK